MNKRQSLSLVTFLTLVALLVSAMAAIRVAAFADEQVPLIMQSDWDHIQDDVNRSVVPTVVLIDDPGNPLTGIIRVRLQEALRNNAAYVHVFEVPTVAPEDPADGYPKVFEVPTILFIAHKGDSLVLLNAATGFQHGMPLEPAALADFITQGLQNLSAPPAAGNVVTMSQGQLATDLTLSSGKTVVYLLGESGSWLRTLEEQVFATVSSTDSNDLLFVIVSDSHEEAGPLCDVLVVMPDPAHPGKTIQSSAPGFLTEQQMRKFIRITTQP